MKRELGDGIELDDDPARVDLAEVHRYLSEESYWAQGRPFEDVELMVGEAARIVGLYDGSRQIGFCRAARCAPGLFYLADVYVLEEYRGRRLGMALVGEMLENGPLVGKRWFLHTEDMHPLYRKFGFGDPGPKVMEK